MDIEQLYNQYKPFIYKLCQKYICPGIEIDDLMQMAYFGLHSAVQTYNDSMGVKFITYMAVCVKRAVLRELDNTSLIRLPSHLHSDIERYRAEAKRCSISSLDVPIGEDNDTTLCDILPDDCEDEHEGIYRRELKRVLWSILSALLDDEQYDVMNSRFKLNLTLTAIAEDKGYTVEWVRQKEAKALRKLRMNRDIRALGKDYGFYGNSYRHVGVSRFNTTWTSSVEAEVLSREQWAEMTAGEILGAACFNSNPSKI